MTYMLWKLKPCYCLLFSLCFKGVSLSFFVISSTADCNIWVLRTKYTDRISICWSSVRIFHLKNIPLIRKVMKIIRNTSKSIWKMAARRLGYMFFEIRCINYEFDWILKRNWKGNKIFRQSKFSTHFISISSEARPAYCYDPICLWCTY